MYIADPIALTGRTPGRLPRSGPLQGKKSRDAQRTLTVAAGSPPIRDRGLRMALDAAPPETSAAAKPAAHEDRRLLVRYHEENDDRARAELVERFMPLVRHIARRYQRGNEPLEDLVQVASLGLVKAIDRFDPARTTAFSSYAVPTMVGELKRYFRDFGWAVHVPRGMQERTVAVQSTVTTLFRSASGARHPPPRSPRSSTSTRSRCSRRSRRRWPTTRSRSRLRARAATSPPTRPSPTRSAKRTSASSSLSSG